MKRPDVYLKEYCQRLSDDNLWYLQSRFKQNLAGDTAEIFDFLSNVREIDKWLDSAIDSDDLYGMIDLVQSSVQKEHEKRAGKEAA